MVAKRENVIELLNKNLDAIQHYGVTKLGLFGSTARGESGEDSDLDFLVEFEKKSFDAYMDLKFFLEGLFDRSVDLVLEGTVKPRLRTHIDKEIVYVPGL